jgi:glycosyltransferase involved in cell wall biosynthesis
VAVATRHVLEETAALGGLAAHLDTSDRRSLDNVGRLDLENVRLAVLHAVRLTRLLCKHRSASVYLPISQARWGFVRDAVLIGLARLAGRRAYAHLNGGSFGRFYEESSGAMRLLIRRTLHQVHQVWVVAPRLRSILEGIVPADHIEVVQNVVDDLSSASRRERSSNGSLRLLFLGNLLPGKGVEDLLAALEQLGPAAAGWQIRLVGELHVSLRGLIEPAVERVKGHGIAVELTGARTGDEKLAELRAADLFVYPSSYREEGQPLVLLEAMASGLPILSTRHAGIPDTVRDGQEGLLIDPGDIDALGSALERIAGDASLRHRLGTAARLRYEDCYTPSRLRRDLAALLL